MFTTCGFETRQVCLLTLSNVVWFRPSLDCELDSSCSSCKTWGCGPWDTAKCEPSIRRTAGAGFKCNPRPWGYVDVPYVEKFYYSDLLTVILAAAGQVSASYSPLLDDLRVPFQKKKFVGIPEGLFQYYESKFTPLVNYGKLIRSPATNVVSHMGLMPEIERAWISIDHKLFLWDYVDG